MWNKKIHIESSMPNDPSGYAMLLGRWQPLHDGHKALFQQLLDEGKNLCIMVRDMPTSEKNPFTAAEVKKNIEDHYSELVAQKIIVVMIVPNITSVNFGRGVGWDVVEYIPPAEIAGISATKIREENARPPWMDSDSGKFICNHVTNICTPNVGAFDGSKACDKGSKASFISNPAEAFYY